MKLHDNFPGFRSYLADPRNELHLRALVVVDLELLVPLVVGSEGEGPRFHAAQARYRWMDLQYTSQRAPPKMSGGSRSEIVVERTTKTRAHLSDALAVAATVASRPPCFHPGLCLRGSTERRSGTMSVAVENP